MLSAKERNLIMDMCHIAGAQGRDYTGKRGEGDYQEWTESRFTLAATLAGKMLEPDPGLELLQALKAAEQALRLFHDNTEERQDPTMRDVGRVLARCQKLIARHQEAR